MLFLKGCLVVTVGFGDKMCKSMYSIKNNCILSEFYNTFCFADDVMFFNISTLASEDNDSRNNIVHTMF